MGPHRRSHRVGFVPMHAANRTNDYSVVVVFSVLDRGATLVCLSALNTHFLSRARPQICTFFQIQHPARSDVVGTLTQASAGRRKHEKGKKSKRTWSNYRNGGMEKKTNR